MADPIIIPQVPGGWCASLEKLVTFVEFLNINFQIFVNQWEERFNEELELPGIPPSVVITPGLIIPAMGAVRGIAEARSAATRRAYTGNRFPWAVGGDVRTPWQFPGFPSLEIPGGGIRIPGIDPMRIIMEFVKVNYEIITERLEAKGSFPVIDWSVVNRGCDSQQSVVDGINNNNENISGGIGSGCVDSATQFCLDSGGDGSCWTLADGAEIVELPDGTFGVTGIPDDNGNLAVLSCGCAIDCAGPLTYGISATRNDPGSYNPEARIYSCPTDFSSALTGACGSVNGSASLLRVFTPLSAGTFTIGVGYDKNCTPDEPHPIISNPFLECNDLNPTGAFAGNICGCDDTAIHWHLVE